MSLDKRKLKQAVIDALRDVPFINHAVRKAGVSRMTFYRWMKKDKIFECNINGALQEGHKNLIEIAESSLAKKIKEGHFGAIKFYLENNHGNYMNRKYRVETILNRNYDDSPAYAFARMPNIVAFDEEDMEYIEDIKKTAVEQNLSQEEVDKLVQLIRDGTYHEVAELLRKEQDQSEDK